MIGNSNILIHSSHSLHKALDTIDHIILIDKLKYYGVHGTNLNLSSSYLENDKQYMEIDNIKYVINSVLHYESHLKKWVGRTRKYLVETVGWGLIKANFYGKLIPLQNETHHI